MMQIPSFILQQKFPAAKRGAKTSHSLFKFIYLCEKLNLHSSCLYSKENLISWFYSLRNEFQEI
jgi:hypothetical protein